MLILAILAEDQVPEEVTTTRDTSKDMTDTKEGQDQGKEETTTIIDLTIEETEVEVETGVKNEEIAIVMKEETLSASTTIKEMTTEHMKPSI